MRYILFIAFTLFIYSTSRIEAQSFNPKVDQTNAWILYNGNHKMSSKWGVHTEFQWRRSEVFSQAMQNLLRLGLDYEISKSYMVSGGWAYIETFEYGDFLEEKPLPKYNQYKFNEQRIWEQFIINHDPIGRFYFDSRFRLEQRWIANLVKINDVYVRPSEEYLNANPNVEDWRFRQRARYRFRLQLPLSNKQMADNTLFLAVADEIFINYGERVTANIFDQNRLYLGLGWRFDKNCNVQAGYMNQFIEKGDGVYKENNHTLQLALTYNIDFSNMFESKENK